MIDRITHPSKWSQTIFFLGWTVFKNHIYIFYKPSSQFYSIFILCFQTPCI